MFVVIRLGYYLMHFVFQIYLEDAPPWIKLKVRLTIKVLALPARTISNMLDGSNTG